MRYFVAEAVMTDPLPVPAEELPKTYIPLHVAHIRSGIDQGRILLAGPKVGESGGLMVIRAEDRTELDRFLNRDPYVVHGIAHFTVREFELNDRAPELAGW